MKTYTPNIGLKQPAKGETAWLDSYNANFQAIDTKMQEFISQIPANTLAYGTSVLSEWIADPSILTDQAAAATAKSLANIISGVSGGPIDLRLPPGTYLIDQDYTVPATVNLKPDKGANLSVSSSKTLTINGPFSAGLHQVFAGAGTVTFGTGAVKEVYPQWWGAKGDNSADDSASMQSAINAAENRTLILLAGTYKAVGNLTITSPIKIVGYGATVSFPTNSTNQGFVVTSSNVDISGLTIQGPQYSVFSSGQQGIKAYGADSSHYLTGIKIYDNTITGWGQDAIYTQFVSDFDIKDNSISNCNYSGVILLSSSKGIVTENRINNITGSPNAYGIAASRASDNSLVNYPRSSDIVISKNVVSNVLNWEALDTHGGERIIFDSNTIYGCKKGITVGVSQGGSSNQLYAPQNCTVSSNVLDSGLTDGSALGGIEFVGAAGASAGTVVQYATGAVTGNVVSNYGTHSNSLSGGMYLRDTMGVAISGNRFESCSPTGIQLYYDNLSFSIHGNVIIDPWSNTLSYAPGIFANDINNVGTIGGNVFSTASKSATKVLSAGIRVNNSAGSLISLGSNQYSPANYLSGAGALSKTASLQPTRSIKQTFTFADFPQASSAPNAGLSVGNIPAGSVITDVFWTLDTPFSGGTISAATIKMGVAGGVTDGFIPATNVFTGATTGYQTTAVTSRGALLYDSTNKALTYFCASDTSFLITANLTGGTGANLTAGQITVWVVYRAIK